MKKNITRNIIIAKRNKAAGLTNINIPTEIENKIQLYVLFSFNDKIKSPEFIIKRLVKTPSVRSADSNKIKYDEVM